MLKISFLLTLVITRIALSCKRINPTQMPPRHPKLHPQKWRSYPRDLCVHSSKQRYRYWVHLKTWPTFLPKMTKKDHTDKYLLKPEERGKKQNYMQWGREVSCGQGRGSWWENAKKTLWFLLLPDCKLVFWRRAQHLCNKRFAHLLPSHACVLLGREIIMSHVSPWKTNVPLHCARPHAMVLHSS